MGRPRKERPRGYSHNGDNERKIVKTVHDWVCKGIARERKNEVVFHSRDKRSVTAGMCGISRRTVARYIKEDVAQDRIERRGRPKIFFDDFDERFISRLIMGFYKRSPPVIPTLTMICDEAFEQPDFPKASRTTMFRFIKRLGFRFKMRNKKMLVYQRLDIVAKRHRFLRDIGEYRASGYTIFYQDETWCYANHTKEYVWQTDESSCDKIIENCKWRGGLNVPSGSGRRIIINHIGSSNGFLEGCAEVFTGKKDSVDYHHEMNHVHFERWWQDCVLPKLPNKSVVVMDNASYHTRQTEESKRPTTSWKKAEIQDWLRVKGKSFDEKDTKPILLEATKEVFCPKQYMLEKITSEYCQVSEKEIVILRLPVGHSELNAIELIWALVKNFVAKHNSTFNITTVKNLMELALSKVSPTNWERSIAHVIKVENAFRKLDFGDESTAPEVDPVIITVDNNSDSSSVGGSSEDDNSSSESGDE